MEKFSEQRKENARQYVSFRMKDLGIEENTVTSSNLVRDNIAEIENEQFVNEYLNYKLLGAEKPGIPEEANQARKDKINDFVRCKVLEDSVPLDLESLTEWVWDNLHLFCDEQHIESYLASKNA